MNIYSTFNKQTFRVQYILPVCMTLSICTQMMGFMPSIPSYITYATCILSVIYLLSTNPKIDIRSLLFLIYLPLTIFIASPDPVFKSFERLLYFAPIFIVGSPLLQNEKSTIFKIMALNTFIIIFIILGVGSFICYFLGINMMTLNRDEIDITYQTAGYFSGLTKQSMILGPVGGIAALIGLYKYYTTKKIIYILLLILGYAACIFSASRGAFIATSIALLVSIYKISKNKILFLKRIILILFILFVTSPLWISGTQMLQEKQLVHKDDKEIFDSRSEKFKYRINEFKSAPLCGVGFSAINPKLGDKVSANGVIEPGSSWLAFLSMTGLIGFIAFLSIFIRSFKKVYYIKNKTRSIFLSCILVLISIHWFIEGYIFAAGNSLCFFSWLMIGVCNDKNIIGNKYKKIILI